MHRRHRRRRLSVSSLNASFNQDTTAPATNIQQSSAEQSDLEVSFADLGQNDDNRERIQARKNRPSVLPLPMVTPIRSQRGANHLLSNRRNSSNRNRRNSPSPFPQSGMRRKQYTNEQLSQIYKECIVKAQTGKINQQNAWTLHLVDNIKEITQLNSHNTSNANGTNNRDQSLSNNAFAIASHTIDAASKIYGYRVDSVHNKTYKVLGSIHQTGDNNGDGLVGDSDELQRRNKRKQRNRNVGKSTLCEPDKQYKINESMKNLCVEVDALFHKTASCFDEGGAKGLLMNTLYVQNGCDIVFDSSTKIEQNENITNEGIAIDHTLVENELEISKENEWMTQLANNTFADFTQPIDMVSPDVDLCTQNKPQNFKIDMKWIEKTSICPLLNVFDNNIQNIANNLSMDLTMNEERRDRDSPEKEMNNGSMNGDDAMDMDNDDDVLLDMPDFTLGGDADGLNAQDLFHEELMTQAQMPLPAMSINAQMNSSRNMNLFVPSNPEYVLGQSGENIIGNMGVQPLLNTSMTDNEAILQHLQREVDNENGSFNNIHRNGIYRRGTINLKAMNAVIEKLENADFENLTSFFDPRKHGNWAGPDQWYHRRYLMTLKPKNGKKGKKSKNGSESVCNSPNARDNANNTNNNGKKPRRKKSDKYIDFMSIANGALIDEKEFEEPQRSYNTLTQAVLDKNRKTWHTLPKDLQIKPDMFIKLFHRPHYSVWKHWMRQHQLRMIKRREELQQMQSEVRLDIDGNAINVGMGMGMEQSAIGIEMGVDTEPQFLAQQAAAMAVMGEMGMGIGGGMGMDDDEDEFKYDYNNPLDSSHFVPDLNENGRQSNQFNFELNGYDLIEMNAGNKLEKIKVEFATKAKKVNVRKLKLKLWDTIHKSVNGSGDKENVNANENMDIEIENGESEKSVSHSQELVTFQDTLDSLPSNISSSISVHMCFICLLHLANEKTLQFVPRNGGANEMIDMNKSGIIDPDRGNFEIQYASAQSAFEKEAQKTNPIMVLGMHT